MKKGMHWGRLVKLMPALFVLALCSNAYSSDEKWDFLSIEDGSVLAVRNISKQTAINDKTFTFSLLIGHEPAINGVRAFTRDVMIECGAPNAILLSYIKRDSEFKIIEERTIETLAKDRPISLISEPELIIATKYVCGDMTAKSAFLRRSETPAPKDTFALTCTIDNSENSVTHLVSLSEKTVNRRDATISDRDIYFRVDKTSTINIDRYTGKFTFANNDIALYGKCVKASKSF